MPSTTTTTTTTTTTPGKPPPPPPPPPPATAPAPAPAPATATTTASPTKAPITTTPTTLLWAHELRRENLELAARLAAAERTITALTDQLQDVRAQVHRVSVLQQAGLQDVDRRMQRAEDLVRGEVGEVRRLVEGLQVRVVGVEDAWGGLDGRNNGGYGEGETEVLVPDSMPAAPGGGGGAGATTGLGHVVGIPVGLGWGLGRGGGLSSTGEGESTSTASTWDSGGLDCCDGGEGEGEGRDDDVCGGSGVMVAGMAGRARGEVCKVAVAVQGDADGACGSGSRRTIKSQGGVRNWFEVLENRGIVRKRTRARRFIPIVPADEEDVLIARAMMMGH
ncbi:hypothetical protein BO82DRAFT_419440 [Aspergillus uvarum CBS 121591]|uniref:Uncharacterized protein n=1 Tax=Aspergillus uvarum CBS 121591 TaxID=1448315 RepID=A0A319CM98_9EURO|nr:hypothetical protein BO82DRAFT_419440 [Aspergillus uvarum CBS 121591]PYH79773.1 hypothetical protein BO82DRAFT_419440 [Aspergillus uvarum CBS 121591]